MKCMSNGSEVVRVSEERAIALSKKGWKFVPKNEWKNAPNTTWVKSSTPANPMSDKKKFRKEKRNR